MPLSPGNKIVNALWIGDTLSPLELLTIKSFLSKGHDFHLWLYQPLKTALPEGVVCKDAATIIPEENIFSYKYKNQFGHGKGSFGGFSDLFRYMLLYEHGGWWTDMDVTCLRPLNFDSPYVFRTHQDLPLVGNIMKCPPKSELMKVCFERALKEVTEENTDWHKPIKILADEVKRLNLEKYIFSFTNDDCWYGIKELYIRQVNIPESWHAIHWVNEEWKKNKVNKFRYSRSSAYGKLLDQYGIEAKQMGCFSKHFFRFKNNRMMIKLRYKF